MVSDFGPARVYDACDLSGIATSGEVGEAPAFAPPAQVTHDRDVKPAAPGTSLRDYQPPHAPHDDASDLYAFIASRWLQFRWTWLST